MAAPHDLLRRALDATPRSERATRRAVLRTVDLDGATWVLKRFTPRAGWRGWRERVREFSGHGRARRALRAGRALRRAGVPTPEPVAACGPWLLMAWCDGDPLAALPPDHPAWSATGRALAELHTAGWLHGDPKPSNALWTDRTVWIDLDRARRGTSLRARARELHLWRLRSGDGGERAWQSYLAALEPPLAARLAAAVARR